MHAHCIYKLSIFNMSLIKLYIVVKHCLIYIQVCRSGLDTEKIFTLFSLKKLSNPNPSEIRESYKNLNDNDLYYFIQVLLHVATSTIQKKNNTYTTKIQENVNTTVLLIDLNYTDGSNAEFHYELTQIIPDGM